MSKYGEIIVGDNHKNIIYEIKDNGCHEIISHAFNKRTGYFKIKIDGKAYDIHRWYYKREIGLDLVGLDVRHKCDNTKCINLEHLCHGTRKDNINDMLVRNRQYSILTKDNVIEIVKEYNTGKYTFVDLAKIYKVHLSTIKSIFIGKTWSHVTGIKLGDYELRKYKKPSNEKYIYWDKANEKWRVSIVVDNKKKNIGRFKTLDEAIIVRDKYLNNMPL